jgi:2-polyprenyl-6-methoxyphenol hydroxylase-like FAD-dependent oxidoreductase
MNTPKVLVVGAGIGGLTAAIALHAKGIDVEICEAAPRPPASGTALGLASNATKVLRALGIDLGSR